MIPFTKVHGTGNDFVLIPDLDDLLALDAPFVRAVCAPHTGLGADGVIRLGAPRVDDADVFMDYRNADGSIAEMCGNGVRCVAKYVLDHGEVAGHRVRVESRAGVRVVEVTARDARGRVAAVRVAMGPARVGQTLAVGGVPAPAADGRVEVLPVSMGNPHAVVLASDVRDYPLAALAAALQRHPAFPDGANVEVIAPRAGEPEAVDGRIVERGVGETMASGTGASAMAVAAATHGVTGRRVSVHLPGGVLRVDWDDDGEVHVTGPAVEVAHGTLDDAWLSTIRDSRT